MSKNVALYYPYIHFRNESWLKVAALYWPRISRIVPLDYETRDSVGVQLLRDELDLIQDLCPDEVVFDVGRRFLRLVQEQPEALSRHCDVRSLVAKHSQAYGMGFGADRVAYIYASQMSYPLREALSERSLAVDSRGHSWVGVHPKLAAVYMCAVAEEIASRYSLHPATDEVGPFAATGAWSFERIARVLLEESAVKVQEDESVYDRFLVASMLTVLPKDLTKVPMELIVAARKRSEHLLADFREYVDGQVNELVAAQVEPDRARLTADITAQMELTVKSKVRGLDKELRSCGFDTMSSLVSLKSALPALPLVAAHAAGAPIEVQGGVAVAAGVAWLARDHSRTKERLIKESPVGYLHSVRGDLRATHRVRRVIRRIGS